MVFGIWTIKSYFAILWIIAIVRIAGTVRCLSISAALAKCAEFQVNRNCHLFFPRLCHWNANSAQAANKVYRKCEKQQENNNRHQQNERVAWKGMKVTVFIHACAFYTRRNKSLFIEVQRNVKQYFPFDKANYLMLNSPFFSLLSRMLQRSGKVLKHRILLQKVEKWQHVVENIWRKRLKYDLNWVTTCHIRDE